MPRDMVDLDPEPEKGSCEVDPHLPATVEQNRQLRNEIETSSLHRSEKAELEIRVDWPSPRRSAIEHAPEPRGSIAPRPDKVACKLANRVEARHPSVEHLLDYRFQILVVDERSEITHKPRGSE